MSCNEHCSKTLEFIIKAKEIHGNKYDYSKVNYVNSQSNVVIVCPKHGEFMQLPKIHKRGAGCQECAGVKRLNTDKFIIKAKEIHGDKYDYSLVDYKNNKQKVKIICPLHGEFEQRPDGHLQGKGCNKCAIEFKADKLRHTQTFFIEKAKKVHGDKYDYSKTNYINDSSKVIVICKKHGEFEQKVNSHLNGRGCAKCAGKLLDQDFFIEKAKKVHGDKYDYSKVDYESTNLNVEIICPEHGLFKQRPNNHLSGTICPKCANRFMDQDFFIEKAKKVHGDKYDYSKIKYTSSHKKIDISCKKHGIFKQRPYSHLSGHGCPICTKENIQSKGEYLVQDYLNKEKHINAREVSAKDIFNNSLFLQGFERTRFDFVLKNFNLIIEFDGQQHFSPVNFGGISNKVALSNYKDTQRNDKAKNLLVEQSKYHLLRIPYWEIDNVENILNDLFLANNKLNQKILDKYTYENNIEIFNKFHKD